MFLPSLRSSQYLRKWRSSSCSLFTAQTKTFRRENFHLTISLGMSQLGMKSLTTIISKQTHDQHGNKSRQAPRVPDVDDGESSNNEATAHRIGFVFLLSSNGVRTSGLNRIRHPSAVQNRPEQTAPGTRSMARAMSGAPSSWLVDVSSSNGTHAASQTPNPSARRANVWRSQAYHQAQRAAVGQKWTLNHRSSFTGESWARTRFGVAILFFSEMVDAALILRHVVVRVDLRGRGDEMRQKRENVFAMSGVKHIVQHVVHVLQAMPEAYQLDKSTGLTRALMFFSSLIMLSSLGERWGCCLQHPLPYLH